MSSANFTFQKKENVAIITMNAAAKNHADMVCLSEDLNILCSRINSDKAVRVVILNSSMDNAFSLGENLITEQVSVGEQNSVVGSCTLSEPIAGIDQPVIAGIKGNAIGYGLEMVLACDIRIATEASTFGLPHIKSGRIPSDGGVQRLSRLVGRGKALEMVLAGETIDAQEADRIGLVNKIVPFPDLEGAVSDMAHEMAAKSPYALKYAKEAVYKGMDLTLEQGLRLEADLYFLLHTTQDRREGITAFKEKRKPQFSGK